MAKRKTKTRSRKKAAPEKEPTFFWPMAGAIVLIILALFMLLGGFHTGGPLPKGLFEATFWVLGWSAYLAPVALIYFGVIKFTAEDHKIPLSNLVSMLSGLLFTACWLFVAFASKDFSGAYEGGYGGRSGELIGGTVLGAIDKFPSALMFFIFAVLSFFFAFGVSPKVLLKIVDFFKSEKSDSELAELKDKQNEETLNIKGLPVDGPKADANVSKHSSFKNTAQKLSGKQMHTALTTASDPDWKLPSTDLLNHKEDKVDPGNVKENAKAIKETLQTFNIDVGMDGVNIGPSVAQYTLKPPSGTKLTKITALETNIALDLAATSIRIEAPIPGKKLVGIEVPNLKSATVRLSSLLESKQWEDSSNGELTFAIGKDISGAPVLENLATMPHLLVAGQTGSGKSVMINTILTSLLYRNSPSDLKLILVDPKRVELAPYDEIPHLLTPVIVEPEKCISALKWTVAEMERRYKELSASKTRNIVEYNEIKNEEGMPYIVVVIDELADLMMMAARDVESLIVRIAQKARAVGIHLILATQRPSVNIITGLIKANVPARIAFTVPSLVDSRTIIDQAGAEKLLGKGDMLLQTSAMPKPKRIQGAFIDVHETNKVTNFIREQRKPQYDDEITSQPVQLNGKGGIVPDMDVSDDKEMKDAVEAVISAGKASTSLLQRKLRIGYGKASRLIDTMEEQGIVGAQDGSRPREVLVSSVDEVFGGAPADTEQEADVYDDMPDEEDKY